MRKGMLGVVISMFFLGCVIIGFSCTIGSTGFEIGNFFAPLTGFWQNAESAQQSFGKSQVLHETQFNNTVKVVVDDQCVPHIFAEQMEDLYFVEGYMHARYRLFQMEYMARKAAGRLSEIFGKQYLLHDRLQRRLGIPYYTKINLQKCTNSIILQALNRYAEGVNYYIQHLAYADYPIEYKLYNCKPESWTPLKTLLVLKLLAQEQSGEDKDWANTLTKNIMSIYDYEQLYPIFHNINYPVMPAGYDYENINSVIHMPISADTGYFVYNQHENLASPLYNETAFYQKGSSSIAIAGQKTTSGFPLLANFMYGKLDLPNQWFEMQISSDLINIYGISIPGVPALIEGFNDNLAWAISTTNQDVKDYYQLQLNPHNPAQYWYNHQWITAPYSIEAIKVKDENTIYDTVYYSIFGPITFTPTFSNHNVNYGYATKWMLNDTTNNDLMPYYMLNLAQSYEEFSESLPFFNSMNINITYADNTGIIFNKQVGKLPAKWYTQGDFVMPGNDSSYQWQSIVPPTQTISIKSPSTGFIVTTNQSPADKMYPYYLGKNFDIYRSYMFNQALSKNNKWDIKLLHNLLGSTYNPFAKQAVEKILFRNISYNRLSDNNKTIYNILKNWDYTQTNPYACVIFNLWWNDFYHYVVTSLQQQYSPNIAYISPTTLLEWNISANIDSIATVATFNTIANFCISKSNIKKDWYIDYLSIMPHHITAPFLSGQKCILTGSPYSILPSDDDDRTGTTWRMMVDLNNHNAFGILFGGQSGNPGSFFYNNNIADWNANIYHTLKRYPTAQVIDKKTNFLIFKK